MDAAVAAWKIPPLNTTNRELICLKDNATPGNEAAWGSRPGYENWHFVASCRQVALCLMLIFKGLEYQKAIIYQ
jgi:hypothetical protein